MTKADTDTFRELRGRFDGRDPFMTRGHQIIKMRRGNHEIPEWVKDAEKFRKILLRSFPKMATNKRQRAGAGRWVRLVYLYYNLNMTTGQVAVEMKMSIPSVKFTLVCIRRVSKGIRANGTGKIGERPRGRPRKVK